MTLASSSSASASSSSDASSSIDEVDRYARQVVAGEIIAGPYVRGACRRHLDDLATGAARGIWYDPEAAAEVFEFFERVLTLAEGEFAGKPFLLQPWQKFILGSLFGWKRGEYRRFRTAFLEIGKGNGKSPMAAGVGLFMLTADDEPSAEVYAAAVTRDQAKIMFRDAESMVDASKSLSKRLLRTVNNIAYSEARSYFRAISSEGRQLDGKRVHCALLDEVHEHPKPVVVNKMRAGTKGRRQALIFMITNSGHDRETICYYHHEYGKKIVEKTLENDSYFSYICALDKDDDWHDEACWLKANPNLGVSITIDYLRELVTEARGMLSQQNIVRRLNFCEWTESESAWIERDVWDPCGRDVPDEQLDGLPCVAALDLSGSRDLTSLLVLFRGPAGERYVRCWNWLPGEELLEREQREGIPWTAWRDLGLLRTCEGKAIDRGQVGEEVFNILRGFGCHVLAFDRWRSDDLIRVLEEHITCRRVTSDADWRAEMRGRKGKDLLLCDWGQGYKDMAPSIDATEVLLLHQRLWHGPNPILTMCAANAAIAEDDAGNRKFTKRKSAGRIDAAQVLAMACGLDAKVGDNLTHRSPYADGGGLLVLG